MVLLQPTVGVPLLRALLFPILFLAPGLLALRPALWTARLRDTLSRLQKIVYSVVFSSSSFFLIYLGWSLLRWKPLSPDDELKFAILVAVVPVHFLLTVLVGVAVGSFFHNYVGTARGLDEFESWEFAFDRYESGELIVRTDSGKEVRGEILEGTQIDRSEGVLLTASTAADDDDTTEVREEFAGERTTADSSGSTEEDGETKPVQLEDSDAQYTYFPREEIETVFFLDEFVEDPNVSQKDQNDRAQSFLSDVYSQFEPYEVTPYFRWWVDNVSRPSVLFGLALLSLVGCVLLLTGTHPQLGSGAEVALLGVSGACWTGSVVVLTDRCTDGEWAEWLFAATVVALVSLVFVTGLIRQPLALARGVLVGSLIAPLCVSVAETYGRTPAVYVTAGLSAAIVLAHSVFGFGGRVTQQSASLVLLVAVTALAVNRLRVGTAEEFDDWERVAADTTKWLLFGLVAAAVAVPSQLVAPLAVRAVSLAALLPAFVLGGSAVRRVNTP